MSQKYEILAFVFAITGAVLAVSGLAVGVGVGFAIASTTLLVANRV